MIITARRVVASVVTIAMSLALLCEATVGSPSTTLDARRRLNQCLAIVVNRSNPIDDLSFIELRKIFLGERNQWSNGHRIAITMLDYGPERRTILRLVYRMDEDGYQDHILRGMFRGDVFVAVKTLSSPVIMRRFVFNAPGAIGYLRANEADDSVKVLRIDGLLPNDKDYRLQMDEPVGLTER